MIESVFMSTFGCFILSEQLFTASKNKSNDDKLCMISNFYNKILYINFKCLILESTVGVNKNWTLVFVNF